MYFCSKQSLRLTLAQRRGKAGLHSFTLVEVVIAIGVATFILISLLGMMTYGSQMVQQSDKYSRLSIVTSQVLAKLGSEQFAACPYGVKWAGGGFGSVVPQTNYYTYQGLPTNSVNGTNIYFQAVVADATPTTGPMFSKVASQQVMEPLQVSILWPTVGTAPFANTNIIVTSVVNYNSL